MPPPIGRDRLPPALWRVAEALATTRTARVRRIRLTQEGEMRLQPGARWLPFRAEQVVSTRDVAFRWRARVRMAPLVTAVVEDAFERGRGRLNVKLWGYVPVASATGAGVDQGEVQRYLAELAWNPLALLCNEELNYTDGEAGGHRVWWGHPDNHVDLHVDGEDRIVRTFSRTRPRDGEKPTPWEGHFDDHADFGDLSLPRRGEVAWLLPEGRFSYWRGTLLSCDCLSETEPA